MLPAGHQQATSSVLYTTSCKHSPVLLRMSEIIARNMFSWLKCLVKLLLLHIVGCLYYCINDARLNKHQIWFVCVCVPSHELSKSFSFLEGEVLLFTNNEACGWWGKQNLLKLLEKRLWYSQRESFICIDVYYKRSLRKLHEMGYVLKLEESVWIHFFTLCTIMVKFVKESLNFKCSLTLFLRYFNSFRNDLSKTSLLLVFFFCIKAKKNERNLFLFSSYNSTPHIKTQFAS